MYGLIDILVNLNIGNNQIIELDECVLNKFIKLEMLYINNFFLYCDCKIIWLYDWLNELRIKNDIKYYLIRVICIMLVLLFNKVLFSVNRFELMCNSSYIFKRCNDFILLLFEIIFIFVFFEFVMKIFLVDRIFSFEKIFELSFMVRFEW